MSQVSLPRPLGITHDLLHPRLHRPWEPSESLKARESQPGLQLKMISHPTHCRVGTSYLLTILQSWLSPIDGHWFANPLGRRCVTVAELSRPSLLAAGPSELPQGEMRLARGRGYQDSLSRIRKPDSPLEGSYISPVGAADAIWTCVGSET